MKTNTSGWPSTPGPVRREVERIARRGPTPAEVAKLIALKLVNPKLTRLSESGEVPHG